MKSDKQIQADILDEFVYDPVIDPAEIGVAVKNGVVMLSGTVDSTAKRIAAEEAARRVPEIKGIAEEIVVTRPHYGHGNDVEIADAVFEAMKWNSFIPSEDIRVKVASGWVTLEGSVDWQYQKEAASRVIENLTGVKGVNNMLHVRLMGDPQPVFKPSTDTGWSRQHEKVVKKAGRREFSLISIILFAIVAISGAAFMARLLMNIFGHVKIG